MKRKGSETMSPGLSVVIHSHFDESKVNDVDTPASSIATSPLSMLSQISPTSSQTWEETRDNVDKILLQFEGPKASNDIAKVKANREIIKQLEDNVEVLKSKADVIKDQVQAKINSSIDEMKNEKASIRAQQERLDEIENEISGIKKNTLNLIEVEKVLKNKIDSYRELASQEVEQLDEVEEEKKAEVYRLQKHISLLALVSGIQWDYDCVDSIAGEVEIPSTGKLIRFEINRDDHTPFEIANMLWDTIDSR